MRWYIYFILLLFISIPLNLSSQESLLSQRVKYRASNRDLSNVLVDLSNKAGINIVFNITDIPEKRISIYSPDYSLSDVLDFVLKDTELKYEVVGKQIVVYLGGTKTHFSEYNIKGYIYDEITGEKLIFANIYLPDFSKGTISNEYGFYSLTLNESDKTLIFSYLGYINKTVKVDFSRTTDLNISLKPKPDKILKEVLITDSRLYNKRIEFFESKRINIDRIEKMVHLFGEDDILRFMSIKPGVLTGADGFGGIHVRGGNSGDNAILLDGVPVYNAQHAIGLLSIFNSSVIKNSRFLKGDFPARYGGSLSAVMDIRTRDGNNKKFGGELDVGLLTVKGLFEGPIIDNKSSILISFRRTYFDIWKNTISNLLSDENHKKEFSYFFYDLNMKLNFELNSRNRLFFSFYSGDDSFLNNSIESNPSSTDTIVSKNTNNWNWGNKLLSSQWNYQIGKRLFVNTTVFYSLYNLKSNSYDSNLTENSPKLYQFSGRILDSHINDIGVKVDFGYSMIDNYFRWGIIGTIHKIEPFVFIENSVKNDIPDETDIVKLRDEIASYKSQSKEFRYYFEDKIEFGRKTNLNIGIHLAHFLTQDVNYYSLEPRIILNQSLGNNSILTLSVTKMSQFIHTLTNNGLGLPSEIILPSTKYLRPEKTWHVNAGLLFDLNKSLNLGFKAYYKNAENLVAHKDGSYFVVSKDSDWEIKIPGGLGYMYGLESELKFHSKRLYFWLNYTISKSFRKYKHINGDKPYEYRFSRLHYLNFISVFKITKKINFNLTAVFGSGNPYTLPTQLTPDNQLLYEEKNNFTLPYYQRVDVGIETKFEGAKVNQELKFGIYNVLNRKNPFYIIYKGKQNSLLESDFKEIYVFPFFPTISYKVVF